MKIDPSFAEEIISQAVKSGADQAEVFMKSYKNLTVDIKGQEVDSLTSSLSYGYGLRVIRNNRLGFAYATDIKEKNSVIKQAVESAGFSDEDSCLGLPEPSEPAEIGVYDPAVSDIKEDDAIDLTMLLEKSAFDTDSRIKKVRKASGSFTTTETVIVNSKSVNASYLSTACTAQIMAIAEDGQESQTGWDFSGSRFLSDVSFEKTGTNSRRTLCSIARRKDHIRVPYRCHFRQFRDNRLPRHICVLPLLRSPAEGQIPAAEINWERLIISPRINIIDSGLRPGKLGSRPVDDEGVPTSEKILVHEGVLQTYLYNTYTARKGNTHSTGNAARGSFSSLPSVGITNLFIEPSAAEGCLCKKELFRLPWQRLIYSRCDGGTYRKPDFRRFLTGSNRALDRGRGSTISGERGCHLRQYPGIL